MHGNAFSYVDELLIQPQLCGLAHIAKSRLRKASELGRWNVVAEAQLGGRLKLNPG